MLLAGLGQHLQDLGHSFSHYGPPGWSIVYNVCILFSPTANAGSIRIPIGGQLIYDTMSKTADLCLSPHMCPPCVLDALCQQDQKPNLGTTATTYSTEVSSSSTSPSPTATTELTSTASAPTTETSAPTEEPTISTSAPTSSSSTTEQTQPSASQVTSITEITGATESTYTASTYPTTATTVGGGMEQEGGGMFLLVTLFIGRFFIFFHYFANDGYFIIDLSSAF